jgi:predicted amino acid dehydrogenase
MSEPQATAGKPVPFGFVVHPPTLRHVRKALPATRVLPDSIVRRLVPFQQPYLITRASGIRSALGAETHGFFTVCPLLPRQMLDLELESVLQRIVGACRIAENLGAKIIGLGGYTSVVGDKGRTVAARMGVAVTSGSAMTAWASVEAIRRLARARGVDPARSTLAVVGASGAIGSLCTRVLAPEVGKVVINARHEDKLERLRREVASRCSTEVVVEMDAHRAVAAANLIVTTTSAPDALFTVEELRPGSVVADVSVPKNISKAANPRPDVAIVDGGRVQLPGEPEFSVSIGLARGVVYACMAETIALALEGRPENFSLGDDIEPARVEEIGRIGLKHGFDVWMGQHE